MDDFGFALVTFARVDGAVHKQRVTYAGESPSVLIPRAVKAAKRRKVAVANCLAITRNGDVLFDAVEDLHRRLR